MNFWLIFCYLSVAWNFETNIIICFLFYLNNYLDTCINLLTVVLYIRKYCLSPKGIRNRIGPVSLDFIWCDLRNGTSKRLCHSGCNTKKIPLFSMVVAKTYFFSYSSLIMTSRYEWTISELVFNQYMVNKFNNKDRTYTLCRYWESFCSNFEDKENIMIGLIVFYAVSAIFQPYKSGKDFI